MNRRRHRFALALPCAIAAVGAFYFALAPKTRPAQTATLNFAERVAYQRAIEEVYWRHRIWPGGLADAKPALDQVMSPAQIEKKVAVYLRNSLSLADYWQRPLSAEQLQAEMDRMAQETKQPDVLRELFAALDNDPFIIAECLARPILAERWLTNAALPKKSFKSWRTPNAEDLAVSTLAAAGNYTLPPVTDAPNACSDATWTSTTTNNAPSPRNHHTAVWTGSEMIVWGGFYFDTTSHYLNTGAKYVPSTDSWTATSVTNAPTGRYLHTAVWTGSEMIVWGGYYLDTTGHYLNTGSRYNPAADTWTGTSTTNAPLGREWHTAVWTGSEMIIWAGDFFDGTATQYLNSGGRYNPGTDGWTTISSMNAPAVRNTPKAVWTGSEMVAWGGYNGSSYLNTGGKYNPGNDSWTATSMINTPTGRNTHGAVWTGTEMIVWGGFGNNVYLNTGGRYNPSSDSWTTTSTINAPSARLVYGSVWTTSEMVIWGGYDGANYLNTGGRYNPSSDSWISTSTINAPVGRSRHTGVWTGNEMIDWGGTVGQNAYTNTGGRYCASSSSPTPTPTPTPLPKFHVSANPTQTNEGQSASYKVTASMTLSQSITIGYAMSGTATNGTDYTLTGTAGQVTIPAGQSSAKVTLRATTDHVTEGTETAIMTLQPGSGYRLGNPKQATVSILDGP